MKGTARSPPAWWGSLSGRRGEGRLPDQGEALGSGWLGLLTALALVSMQLMLTGRLLCVGRYSGCPGWGKRCVGP